MTKGIDVSKWNGVINFDAVKDSGIDFVIIRAGYGKESWQKDPYFESNYEGAKKAGLKVGAYWYSYADSIEEAKKEASACLFVLDGRKFDLPVYYDVEESKQFNKGKNFIDSIITVFCDIIGSAGFTPGLYMSASPLKTHVSEAVRTKYEIWVAQYNVRCSYTGEYSIWQYSPKGSVPGINGQVDMNYGYKDFCSTEKTVDELSREVIAGKWGNGQDRKNRLTAAGYNYRAVQDRVNEILR